MGRKKKNAFSDCSQSTVRKNGLGDLRDSPKQNTSRGTGRTDLSSAEAEPAHSTSPSPPSTQAGLGKHARARERQSKSNKAGEEGGAREAPPPPLPPISGESLSRGRGLGNARREVSRGLSLRSCGFSGSGPVQDGAEAHRLSVRSAAVSAGLSVRSLSRRSRGAETAPWVPRPRESSSLSLTPEGTEAERNSTRGRVPQPSALSVSR